MKHMRNRLLALVLALSLLLTACGGGETTAATMHLVKTEGTVQVDNARGKSVRLMENLGLFSGYSVATRAASYAWINMDGTRLAKLDAESQADIKKEDKLLELCVRSGSLFFNITEPLAEDETMNIRTSTMLVGIRGTCGWVEAEDENNLLVFLLRGSVECSVLDEDGGVLASETITAGQAAIMTLDSGEASIITVDFDTGDVPDFVIEALKHPEDWGAAQSGDESELTVPSTADTVQIPWAEAGLEDHAMDWQDDYLEAAMREVTGIYDRDIMLSDVWELTRLRLPWNSDIGVDGITNVSALGELINLRELRLDSNQELVDIGPLANLTNLEEVYLNQTGVSDLSPLAGLVKLKTLQIRYNSWIADLSPLSGLTSLESLEFEMSHDISDLSPLENLTSLKHLWIVHGAVSDVRALSRLTGLESLNLIGNRISDISPLADLKNLTMLGLDENQISDVSPLANLTALETLTLHSNPITDISPVLFVPTLYYDLTEPDDIRPEEAEEPVESADFLLAAYAGTYEPYPAYSYYSGGASVTLDASGVFTGGETNGRSPSSISQNADGSIAILFGPAERYTIYPVGIPTPGYFQDVNANEVNIEYLYTGGGAMNIVYHADPASLGA